jgi:hypothetical protein
MSYSEELFREFNEAMSRYVGHFTIEEAKSNFAELEKELQAICNKHGVPLQDFTGLEGGARELLERWSEKLKP